MSELTEKAVKEGITLDNDVKPSDDKTVASSPTPAENTPKSSESTGQEKETPAPQAEQVKKERFEDNPGFKALKRQKDELAEQLRKAAEREERLLKAVESQRKEVKPEPTDEKEQARQELMRLLGLEDLQKKLEKIEAKNSELSSREVDQAFDKEEERITQACQKFGLDVEQVKAECQEWIDTHPYFGNVDIQPGFYDLAFKAIYFDKQTELAKKAASLEQIKERDKLRQTNTESPSNGSTDKGSTRPASMREHLANMVRNGGGEVSI